MSRIIHPRFRQRNLDRPRAAGPRRDACRREAV